MARVPLLLLLVTITRLVSSTVVCQQGHVPSHTQVCSNCEEYLRNFAYTLATEYCTPFQVWQ